MRLTAKGLGKGIGFVCLVDELLRLFCLNYSRPNPIGDFPSVRKFLEKVEMFPRNFSISKSSSQKGSLPIDSELVGGLITAMRHS